jgi:hypothetical protein
LIVDCETENSSDKLEVLVWLIAGRVEPEVPRVTEIEEAYSRLAVEIATGNRGVAYQDQD